MKIISIMNMWFLVIFILAVQWVYFFADGRGSLIENVFIGITAIWTIWIFFLWVYKFFIEKSQETKKIATQLRYELETAQKNINDLKKELDWGQCEFHNLSYIITPCSTWCWQKEQDKLFSELKDFREFISLFYKCCYEIDEHLKYAKETFYRNVEIKNKIFYEKAQERFLNWNDFFDRKKMDQDYDNFHIDLGNLQTLIDKEFTYDCTNHSMWHLSNLVKEAPDMNIVISKLKDLES